MNTIHYYVEENYMTIFSSSSANSPRPVGMQWGFTRTPLLASKRFYVHRLAARFKCPTVGNGPLVCSLAAIENHHKNKSGCSFARLLIRRGSASVERTRKRCDKRILGNACVNKSLYARRSRVRVLLVWLWNMYSMAN